MRLLSIFLAILVAVELGDCTRRTQPPPGALVVGQSGAQYAKVQDAVNALPVNTTTPQVIFIQAGTYNEQVYIAPRTAPLTIFGETRNCLGYESNTVLITNNIPKSAVTNNDQTATVRNWAAGSKLYNLNLANTAGPEGKQALALSAQATNQGYYGIRLEGWQDTLLANQGLQFYANSYVLGGTDFIFGQRGLVYLHRTQIHLRPQSIGWVTASGRSSATDPSIYVINESDIRALPGSNVTDGSYYLGRPWGAYARVVVQKTRLSKAINPAGWSIWNVGDERIGGVELGEWRNWGEGSIGVRANFSSQLDRPVRLEDVFGANWTEWVDRRYV